MDLQSRVDLDRYLARIGHAPALRVDESTLHALHLAHATHIPFENLDVVLGRPILLDPASLQAKLVDGGRGGYCFEQNLLFAAVLRAIGFDVDMLAARVRLGGAGPRPRTHMLLLVRLSERRWIADVGFGSDGLLEPLRFGPDVVTAHSGWRYRVREEPAAWVVQSDLRGQWVDLYAFSLEPQEVVDYEVANYYVSTHPQSPFVRTLTAQRLQRGERIRLRNRELSIETPGKVASRTLRDHDELLDTLRRVFGLRVPAGARFPIFDNVRLY